MRNPSNYPESGFTIYLKEKHQGIRMKEYSDNELINLIHNADNKHYGFNLLVKTYQEKIYYFVRRMVVDHDDADDVVQNVFIKVWNNLDSFRADSKLFTWLYHISVN